MKTIIKIKEACEIVASDEASFLRMYEEMLFMLVRKKGIEIGTKMAAQAEMKLVNEQQLKLKAEYYL